MYFTGSFFCHMWLYINGFERPILRISKFSKTLNDRLPLKHSSDRPQTLPKRVSDDPQHFIFRRRKKLFVGFFRSWTSFSLVFVKFWGSWDFTPVKFKFLAIFCFRWTCYHLCTTQKWRKYACLRCQNHGVGTGTLGYRYLGAPLYYFCSNTPDPRGWQICLWSKWCK